MVSKLFLGKQIFLFFIKLCCLTIVMFSLLLYFYEEKKRINFQLLFHRKLEIDQNSNLQSSKSNDAYLINSRNEAAVKIVFWVPPKKPPMKSRLERMRKIVKTMNNLQENEDCMKSDNNEQYHCEFSVKSENVSEADVVLFFMFNSGYKISDLPDLSKRKPEQLWVMYAREPPPLSGWVDPLKNLFNWTLSYRMDSDVWVPYGRTITVPQNGESDPLLIANVSLKKWISRKTKLAAGVISNCRTASRREILISKMKETGIGEVDIFGHCGKNQICGRHASNCKEFWNNLATEYKFYLAFENSLCTDYITEKFWRTLSVGMVPVVYGGGNYSFEAPPHSFIDARNFTSVENLMEYLGHLDSNEDEYAKYFEWRRNFQIEENGWLTHDWCSLCKAVHRQKKLKGNTVYSQSYSNLKWWWTHKPNSNESACEKAIFN